MTGCGISTAGGNIVCRCKELGSFSAIFVKNSISSQNTRFYDRTLFIDLKTPKKFFTCLITVFMSSVLAIFVILLLWLIWKHKEVEKRKEVLLEYIKFLVLWKMKIENQENDLIIMKEEIDMMEKLRQIYKKRAHQKAGIIAILKRNRERQNPEIIPKNMHSEVTHVRMKNEAGQDVFVSLDQLNNSGVNQKMYSSHFTGVDEQSITESQKFEQFKRDMFELGFKKSNPKPKLFVADIDEFEKDDLKESNTEEKKQKVVQTQIKRLKDVTSYDNSRNKGHVPTNDELQKNEEENIEIADIEKKLKLMYDTFNLMSFSDNLPEKVTRFLDTIMPREFYSKEISEFLSTWPPTVEVLFEAHQFSSDHTSRDKSYLTKFASDSKIIMMSNPITSIFFNLYTFINPPVIRLGYLACCFFVHFLVNAIAISNMVVEPIDRDNKVVYKPEGKYILIGGVVTPIAACLNYIVAFFIFSKDKMFSFPKGLNELFALRQLVSTQAKLSIMITSLMTLMTMSLSFLIAVRLNFSHGNVVASNFIYGSIFSILMDLVVLDLIFSFLLTKLKNVGGMSCLMCVINFFKKIRMPCYDCWIAVGDLPHSFRNFVEYKHLIHAKSKYRFKTIEKGLGISGS